MTGKTRYVTVLYHSGDPTWFTLDNPPVGLLHAPTRMKIGGRFYFLSAEPPLIDAASGTSVIVVQATTHHSVWGHNINPEGAVYQLTKVDPHDFEIDPDWHKIDSPFAALE